MNRQNRLGAWGLGLGAWAELGFGLEPRASSPQPTMRRRTRALALFLALAGASACRQDMHDAPRYDPLEASTVLPKGSSAQPLVPGTMPRGFLHEDDVLYTGKAGSDIATAFPFAITRADLDRG